MSLFSTESVGGVAKIVKQKNGSSGRNISNFAMLTQSLQKGKTSKMWWSQFSVLVAAGLSPCCPTCRKTGACKNTVFLRKDQTKQSAEIDHTLQKLIFHVQKGDQSLSDIIFVIIIATIINTTNKINQSLHTGRWCSTGWVRRRAWWPPGELPTTLLLCTTLTIRLHFLWWRW